VATDEILCRIADLLAREYGGPGASWDPNQPPVVLESATTTRQTLDLTTKMASRKYASRGHILNIGKDDFQVILATQGGSSSPLTCMAGGPAEPITCNLTSITIIPAAGKTASYQVKAQ